jgi:hypothetical protein
MPDKRFILGFLLIMLTSVITGLRQCQVMHLKEQRPLATLKQAWDAYRAKHFDERTERFIVGPSPAGVETKSQNYGAARRKPPLVFDKTLCDAISQIAQALAGTIALVCIISYVLLLRFDNRLLLARIANPGVPLIVAIPCNVVGGVALVLLAIKRARNLPISLPLLIAAAIVLYGTALILWIRKPSESQHLP